MHVPAGRRGLRVAREQGQRGLQLRRGALAAPLVRGARGSGGRAQGRVYSRSGSRGGPPARGVNSGQIGTAPSRGARRGWSPIKAMPLLPRQDVHGDLDQNGPGAGGQPAARPPGAPPAGALLRSSSGSVTSGYGWRCSAAAELADMIACV
jgi:hypothetical protein